MKRLVACALLALVAAMPAKAAQYAAIVVDARTGEVMHAVEPDTLSYPASLTKIMTLYLLFEAIDSRRVKPDDLMPVSAHAASQPPSKLGLTEGTYLSVDDSIGALITKSANDAATVIAEFLGGGSEDAFARKMTSKARRLGMANTTFRNASGLPDPEQLSTVRDMATLSRALIRDFPHHYHLFSIRSFEFTGGRTINNHNRLLYLNKGYDGIKTGYTHGSGFNLAASAERGGRRLVGVVFGGQSAAWRDSRMTRLVDMAYAGADVPPTMVASKKSKPPAARVAEAKPAKPAKTSKAKAQLAKAKPSFSLVARAEADTLEDPAANVAAKAVQKQAIGYAVQVGAYSREAMARAAAVKAKSLEPALADAKIAVQHQGKGKDGVYVARLTGLSQDEARSSCGLLKKKHIDCFVIAHDPA